MNPLLLACPVSHAPPPPSSRTFRWATRETTNAWAGLNALKPGILVRRAFSWSAIQPTPTSAYNWSGPDAWINAATAAGLKVMAVVSQAPAWSNANPSDPSHLNGVAGNKYPFGHQDAFYAFCAAAAARYPQEKVAYWEIMNEPDLNNFDRGTGPYDWTGDHVGEILDGAARVMVAARSTAKVIGIVRSTCLSSATAWTTAALNRCRGAPIYGISWHDYSRPDAPESPSNQGPMLNQINNSIGLCRANGFNGKFFITEFGCPTTYSGPRKPGYVSEANAALWLPRQSLIHASFAEIEASVQFMFQGTSTDIEEGGMGLLRGPNDRGGPGETSAGPAGSFKPGYYSMKNLMAIVPDNSVVTRLSTGPLWKFQFDKPNGDSGWAIWCTSGTVAAPFTGLTPTVKVTQNDGTSATVATTGGNLTLSATPAVQYVEPI